MDTIKIAVDSLLESLPDDGEMEPWLPSDFTIISKITDIEEDDEGYLDDQASNVSLE